MPPIIYIYAYVSASFHRDSFLLCYTTVRINCAKIFRFCRIFHVDVLNLFLKMQLHSKIFPRLLPDILDDVGHDLLP